MENRFTVSFLMVVLWCASFALCSAQEVGMGINYGRLADNIPEPKEAVALMRKLNFKMVKIYDADAEVLQALANSGLQVSIMVPNQQVPEIAADQSNAHSWVQKNVLPYVPDTKIVTVMVGNEILSDFSIKETTWPALVPAMQNIEAALQAANLAGSIKVTTPVAADALSTSYPPSAGVFRADIADSVVKPMLEFLSRTGSFFCANEYPYFAWAADPAKLSLDYARFGSSEVLLRDGEYEYTNLLDSMTDATLAAMEKLGYGSVSFSICETGWPNQGDASLLEASIPNAALYNNRLIEKTLAAQGSPRRRSFIPTYMFALFNENLKPGAIVERNWGITYPNGVSMYALDSLSARDAGSNGDGASPAKDVPPVSDNQDGITAAPARTSGPAPAPVPPAFGNRDGTTAPAPTSGTNSAPDKDIDVPPVPGNQDGTAAPPAAPEKLSCVANAYASTHASYAFRSKMRNAVGSCDFNGGGLVTSSDPSKHLPVVFPLLLEILTLGFIHSGYGFLHISRSLV